MLLYVDIVDQRLDRIIVRDGRYRYESMYESSSNELGTPMGLMAGDLNMPSSSTSAAPLFLKRGSLMTPWIRCSRADMQLLI